MTAVHFVFESESGEEQRIDASGLLRTLLFYADPGTYFGCAFWFDPPTGGFDEDLADDYQDEFMDRPVPGSAARSVLRDLLAAGLPTESLDALEESDREAAG